MGNGGGGMGPALSKRTFTYGSAPANIYLTIVQGRPNGMPAWGSVLPSGIVWDLVAYVRSISNAPRSKDGERPCPPHRPASNRCRLNSSRRRRLGATRNDCSMARSPEAFEGRSVNLDRAFRAIAPLGAVLAWGGVAHTDAPRYLRTHGLHANAGRP